MENDCLVSAVRFLENAGISKAEADARNLDKHAATLAPGDPQRQKRIFDALISQRAENTPIGYLTGRANLFELSFNVGPGVFVPRRESEAYIASGLLEVSEIIMPVVYDLCAGSGAIGLSVANRRPDASVTLVELSKDALVYARRNINERIAQGGGSVTLIEADIRDMDVSEQAVGGADLVFCNPPYVPASLEIPDEWSVHQPEEAVYAGEDGFEVLLAGLELAAAFLKENGTLIVEHHESQSQAIANFAAETSLYKVKENNQIGVSDSYWSNLKRTSVPANDRGKANQNRSIEPKTNWMHQRIRKAEGYLDQCFAEGLTGHQIVARNQKEVTLADGSNAVEFISCSYLGLEQHPKLVQAAKDAIDEFGVHFSSSRNRAAPHFLAQLDDGLGKIHAGNQCVAFTSVSAVHIGVLPVLGAGGLPSYPIAKNGPVFFVEQQAHASMQVLRGILSQFGPTVRFDEKMLDDLEQNLARVQAKGHTPIILTDGVGSMGGLAPLREYTELLDRFGGYLYVDDAHGTSIFGQKGQGYASECYNHVLPEHVILSGSLSKAFGGAGGYVALASEADVSVIRKVANSLVFGHSIMLPLLAANVASLKLHLDGSLRDLQGQLHRNLNLFDQIAGPGVLNHGTKVPIRGFEIADETIAMEGVRYLRRKNIVILPAFYPTVKKGVGLIRFAVSASHSPAQVTAAAEAISEFSGKLNERNTSVATEVREFL